MIRSEFVFVRNRTVFPDLQSRRRAVGIARVAPSGNPSRHRSARVISFPGGRLLKSIGRIDLVPRVGVLCRCLA